MYAAKAGKPPQPEQFYRDLATPGTLVRKTFTSPAGLHSVSGMNAADVRSLAMVSFGGIGSASSLAKFYAMLANGGELDGRRFFNDSSIHQMSTALGSGMDRVFQIPTAFSAGFMKDPTTRSGRSSVLQRFPSGIRARVAATPLPIRRTASRSPTS
jgi:CubicO group peptidase (beta-lactamase class C family)